MWTDGQTGPYSSFLPPNPGQQHHPRACALSHFHPRLPVGRHKQMPEGPNPVTSASPSPSHIPAPAAWGATRGQAAGRACQGPGHCESSPRVWDPAAPVGSAHWFWRRGPQFSTGEQSHTQPLSGHKKPSLVFPSTCSSPLKELWWAVASSQHHQPRFPLFLSSVSPES